MLSRQVLLLLSCCALSAWVNNPGLTCAADIPVVTKEPLSAVPPINPQPDIVLSEDDLLLCLLQIDKINLNVMLAIYAKPSGTFIPLSQISQFLELGIKTDAVKGTAEGYVARPVKSFVLDMAERKVQVAGKQYDYDPAKVIRMPDDIYVESKLLAQWLSMRIEANRFEAVVNVIPFEPIPLQERLARERRGSNTWGYGNYSSLGYPLVKTPYRFIDWPSVDLTLSTLKGSLNAGSSPGATGSYTGSSSGISTSYYLNMTGDLLWMNTKLDVGGILYGENSSSQSNGGNLVMERVDPSGKLLGPLGARRFSIGNINPLSLPLLSQNAGNGVMVSSYPVNQASLFDKVSLKGYLADGWDVELYRNGSLLDYRPSNPEHAYAFVDIPLVYGLNRLKLVFYGPQGEKRSETHVYNIGSNMMKPGSFCYQVAATDASASMFPTTQTTTMNRQQGTALTWRSTFGISKRLTIDNFLASEMIDGEWRDYVGGGFTGYLNMVQVDVQVTRDLTSSLLAKQIAVQSSFDPLLFSFQLADYDSSWKFGSGMTVYQRQWKFGVDGLRFKFPFSRVSSCRLALKYTETEYSPDHTEKNAAITNYNQLLGINNSNSVIFQRVQNGTTRQDNVTGTSYINLLRGHVSLRGGVDYRILPDRIINNIEATGDIRLTKTFQMINTLGYSPGNSTFSEALTLNYTAPAFALALTGNYRTDQNWSAGIRLSMNLSRDPSRNKWVRDGSMRSQQGSIAARAFLDENRNGTFDSEEPLLKDVSFFINGQNNNTLTEKNGIAFIKGVSANTPADVSVSPTTLENLLWVPSGKGSCVVPRPGRPAEADFPIIVTGEISGTVTWRKEDSSKAAPGIIVQAVNGKGDVVGKTLTAYDGFFELKGVPPGEFTLRVSPEQAEKLGVVSPSKSVVIPPEGAFVDQIDLNLESISADGTGKE